jgi:hypothetical protein
MKYTATFITSLFLSVFSPVAVVAQTAPDFTIVTTDGVTRNLYSVLDSGKTVILDFFYPTCQGCWFYAPVIEQNYQANGAGSGNVQYWGINGGFLENNAQIDAYCTQYGVSNPCASGLQGNGAFVDSLYTATFGVFSYPTYAVVCPDRRIYWSVNYPPTANGFDPYINDSCGTLGIGAVNAPNAISIYPNPVHSSAVIRIAGLQEVKTVTLFSADGKCIDTFVSPVSDILISNTDLSPGLYFCVVAFQNSTQLRTKFVVQ